MADFASDARTCAAGTNTKGSTTKFVFSAPSAHQLQRWMRALRRAGMVLSDGVADELGATLAQSVARRWLVRQRPRRGARDGDEAGRAKQSPPPSRAKQPSAKHVSPRASARRQSLGGARGSSGAAAAAASVGTAGAGTPRRMSIGGKLRRRLSVSRGKLEKPKKDGDKRGKALPTMHEGED